MPGSGYIPRQVEQRVLQYVDEVRRSGSTMAILLYGAGGVGKTRMLRDLASRDIGDNVRWVEPIDVDDSEYWVIENLQRRVARVLDPEDRHFRRFHEYLSRLPGSSGQTSRETIASHHRRLREEFVRCYRQFIEETDSTVVIALDTVEVIRDSNFLVTLSQWMPRMPRTLFVLSGRPAEADDPITRLLNDEDARHWVERIEMPGFTVAETQDFLAQSVLGGHLDEEIIDGLVALTEGHPLWLELAVDYLCNEDVPPELDEGPPYPKHRREEFRRRLVSPFRRTDFWSEAVNRLAVVRHNVNQEIWTDLMDDCPLPEGVTWDEAWTTLCAHPWIRSRANGADVTLHDALAQELTLRLIPLHDQDETWRAMLWRKAARIFHEATAHYQEVLDAIDAVPHDNDAEDSATALQQLARLDIAKRRLDQLRVARLHYLLLSDFAEGVNEFTTMFARADQRNDLHFMELAYHEIHAFLPRIGTGRLSIDAIGVVVDRFRSWLTERPSEWLTIGLDLVRFLVDDSRPRPAIHLLDNLPSGDDLETIYRLEKMRGNAFMRIQGEVVPAGACFHRALDSAQLLGSVRLVAEAHKELGFYKRNLGKWGEADGHYCDAEDAIRGLVVPGALADDRAELASIQTNWSYLKALRGDYDRARSLVETALEVRRKLNRPLGMAISLSTAGEVNRYARDFSQAWECYGRAEEGFSRLRNQPWLGLIYQEQAICLFQAHQADVELHPDQFERAKLLVVQAVDICRERAVRSYPSALNRAGRILGVENPDHGLEFLEQAISQAEAIADGWFLSASLIELLELSYTQWAVTQESRYREKITDWAPKVEEAIRTYEFADLEPRWRLVQNHLAMHDVLARNDYPGAVPLIGEFAAALAALAHDHVGSHGVAALDSEFSRLAEWFQRAPLEVRREWDRQLRNAWTTEPPDQATALILLDRLSLLY
ncbi:tetratricopeptide repeat protein [Actinophytocola sp.]|uniref:tetratricopeptide repeat protein n=1 Tax=Actinophytocola sp. TaxID=1872138 RepID=UPI00389A928C